MATARGNSALRDLEQMLQRAREIAQRAADPTLSPEAHAALNRELEALRSGLRELGATAAPSAPNGVHREDLAPPRHRPAPAVATYPEPLGTPQTDEAYEPVGDEPELVAEDYEDASAEEPGRDLGRKILLGLVLAVLVGFVLGLVFTIGARVWKARQVAMQSTERFDDLRQTLGDSSFSLDSLTALEGACQQAGELERDLAPLTELAQTVGPASQLLGQVPQIGDRASATVTLVQAAGEISSAARVSCDALAPLATALSGAGDTPTIVAALVSQLAEREGELRATGQRLGVTWQRLEAIDETTLDDTSRRALTMMRDKLPSAANRLALLAEAPTLLGAHGPRTYLVLGQNSDELRPTGGFIGTMGVLTFDKGRLTQSDYRTSFSVALAGDVRVPPPMPLQQFMAARYWQFWESNWWPDFPSSAIQADYFLAEQRQLHVDGVLAVDQDIIRRLLRVTGPVHVSDFNETVSAENVQDRLEFHVHEANYPDPVRKNFVTALFGSVVDQLTHLPRERVGDLSGALYDGFAEQRMQMWSRDDRVQQTLSSLSWDGRMLETDSDYLYVVSANLSANKINREVEQSVSYSITHGQGDRARADVSIHIKNIRETEDPWPFRTADYHDYLRVYVPRGAELIQASGLDTQAEMLSECGLTAFGGLVVVKPGQERQVTLSYALPPWIGTEHYSLTVQKQPGVKPYRFELHGRGAIQGDTSEVLEGTRVVRTSEQGLVSGPLPKKPVAETGSRLPRCAVHESPPVQLAPPAAVVIPRLGINAPVMQLGVDDKGTLEAPATGDVVAWYPQGARPGHGGNMVMAGHVDWDRGPAVFARLAELRPGDHIGIPDAQGVTHTYEVRWTQQFDAKEAPLNRILGPTSERWLTMITCGGLFDRTTREYKDRVVVRAELVS